MPDSFKPRRLASVMKAMSPRQSSTRRSTAAWNAGMEMMAATPAEMETATVRM